MTSRQTEPDLVDIMSGDRVMPETFDSQLIDIGMENAVDKPYAGTLVWVLIGQFDVNLPMTSLKGC